ncbi:MAG: hypothetical protein EKK40_01095 [Bradyrhizobiaceae bacterium]|nr:MAG: hypothetical protein EKK40_01095 [Bradyrhizobiaceae bacterium]
MPPFVLIVAGIVGGAALLRLAAREARRINRELDETRKSRDFDKDGMQRLHRDPQTGTYRPN